MNLKILGENQVRLISRQECIKINRYIEQSLDRIRERISRLEEKNERRKK